METRTYSFKGIKVKVSKKATFYAPEVSIEGAPELKGTEKQIKWAEDIRKEKVITLLEKYRDFKAIVKRYYSLNEDDEKIKQMNKEFEEYGYKLLSETKASKWIEDRSFVDYQDIFKIEFRHIFK